MKLGYCALTGILSLFFHHSRCSAQSADSSLYNSFVSSLRTFYLDEIGDNAQIYHGSEFIRNGFKVTGFQFYKSDSLLRGYISYQGTVYLDKSLQYDLVTDELITNNYQRTSFISLSSEKVDSFAIENDVFIRLHAGLANRLTKTGFYGQLFSGEPGLYVNRYKKFVPATGSIDPKYTQYNEYFIKKNGIYYSVDGKNSLLDLFSDKKEELKKYIRSNKIKFNRDLESSLVRTTIYYSGLKN